MKLEFLAEAEAEFCKAAVFYEEKERGLGQRFRLEVEDVCSAILDHPLIWREREEDSAGSIVRSFPITLPTSSEETSSWWLQ